MVITAGAKDVVDDLPTQWHCEQGRLFQEVGVRVVGSQVPPDSPSASSDHSPVRLRREGTSALDTSSAVAPGMTCCPE